MSARTKRSGEIISITAHRTTGADTGIKERLQKLAPSLAALLYPFALKGFNASVTRIAEGGAGALGYGETANEFPVIVRPLLMFPTARACRRCRHNHFSPSDS